MVMKFSDKELALLSSNQGLKYLLETEKPDFREVLTQLTYEEKLTAMQIRLIELQKWVEDYGKRIIVIAEGRDFAGKGGTIRTISDHLNPRVYRHVALDKPKEKDLGQWYFKRYINLIPDRGEMVFFDRSWYNRAVVEPVNGFCTKKEYRRFMEEVNNFEDMLIKDGIYLFKFYLDISKNEQIKRIEAVKNNPLTRWQLTKVDLQAVELWDRYTAYTERMFEKTNGIMNPWHIINANDTRYAHLECIEIILDKVPYQKPG